MDTNSLALETATVSELVGESGEALGDLPVPQPVPDANAFLRERRLCLSRSTARMRNYLAYQASGRRSAKVDYQPIRLDIENVSRCNFRCTMCTVSDWHKGKRAEDMPLDTFRQLIDDQVGLVEIKLQGLGEPTIQGDPYFEMIRYARARHIWVRTTTNASLLHLRDNYRKLIDSGVNEVQISIDGADKETFESIRIGADFERVVDNCKLINAYCAERNLIRTKMWTVMQRGNRHQLPQLVDLAHEMGFRTMVFSLNLHDFGVDRWREINAEVAVEKEFTRAEAMALIERGRRLGITVAFWNVTDKYHVGRPETLCPWPFERAFISSDLRMVPCCIISNPDVYEFGQIEPNFSTMWTGDKLEEFRREHLEGRIPRACQSCYAGH